MKPVREQEALWLWLNDHEDEAHDRIFGMRLVRNHHGGGPAVFIGGGPYRAACRAHEQLLSAVADLMQNLPQSVIDAANLVDEAASVAEAIEACRKTERGL